MFINFELRTRVAAEVLVSHIYLIRLIKLYPVCLAVLYHQGYICYGFMVTQSATTSINYGTLLDSYLMLPRLL